MPGHLAAYTESFDGATLQRLTALADEVLTTVETDFFTVPDDLSGVIAAYVNGTSATRARIEAASLGDLDEEIAPIDRGADEPASNPPFTPRWENPLVLQPGEKVAVLGAEDGTTTRVTCGLWLGRPAAYAVGPPVPHRAYRLTGTTTLSANAWTSVALTADLEIPPGLYGIVGMRAEAAGARLARVAPIAGGPRMGCIAFDAASDLDPNGNPFRGGRLREPDGSVMVWGLLTHTQRPPVEFFSASADTAETVVWDIIRLGAAPETGLGGGGAGIGVRPTRGGFDVGGLLRGAPRRVGTRPTPGPVPIGGMAGA